MVQAGGSVGDWAAPRFGHLLMDARVAEDMPAGGHQCWVSAAAAAQRAQRRVCWQLHTPIGWRQRWRRRWWGQRFLLAQLLLR